MKQQQATGGDASCSSRVTPTGTSKAAPKSNPSAAAIEARKRICARVADLGVSLDPQLLDDKIQAVIDEVKGNPPFNWQDCWAAAQKQIAEQQAEIKRLKAEKAAIDEAVKELRDEVDLWKRQSAFESEHREKYRQRLIKAESRPAQKRLRMFAERVSKMNPFGHTYNSEVIKEAHKIKAEDTPA